MGGFGHEVDGRASKLGRVPRTRKKGDLSFSASFAKEPGLFSDIGSDHSLFDGRWHRVAVTYSAHDAEVCFYVDGQLVRCVPRDGGRLLGNQGPVRLAGGFTDPRVKPPKTVAVVSQLCVWNRALSAKEIAALCVGPTALDNQSDGGSAPTRRWMRTGTSQGKSDHRAHECQEARADL